MNGSYFITLAELRVGRGPEGEAHVCQRINNRLSTVLALDTVYVTVHV